MNKKAVNAGKEKEPAVLIPVFLVSLFKIFATLSP